MGMSHSLNYPGMSVQIVDNSSFQRRVPLPPQKHRDAEWGCRNPLPLSVTPRVPFVPHRPQNAQRPYDLPTHATLASSDLTQTRTYTMSDRPKRTAKTPSRFHPESDKVEKADKKKKIGVRKTKATKKAPRKQKDPNAPKRAKTPYIIFATEERSRVQSVRFLLPPGNGSAESLSIL